MSCNFAKYGKDGYVPFWSSDSNQISAWYCFIKDLTNYLNENSTLTFGSCSIHEVHSASREELSCEEISLVQEGRTTLK